MNSRYFLILLLTTLAINSASAAYYAGAVDILAPDAVIQDNIFQGNGDEAGILIWGWNIIGDNPIIFNNTFIGNDFGILTLGGGGMIINSSATILGNTFISNNYDIGYDPSLVNNLGNGGDGYLYASTIQKNSFSGKKPIFLGTQYGKPYYNIDITQNNFTHPAGISSSVVTGASQMFDIEISNNDFQGNNMDTLIDLGSVSSERISIKNNNIVASSKGVNVGAARNSIFEKNIFQSNAIALIMGTGTDTNNLVRNNRINVSSIIAIDASTSAGNTFTRNNFSSNVRDVAASDSYLNTWNTPVIGNYWDKYNNPDNNMDGIGDIPYTVDYGASTNNIDYLPSAVPFSITLNRSEMNLNSIGAGTGGTYTSGIIDAGSAALWETISVNANKQGYAVFTHTSTDGVTWSAYQAANPNVNGGIDSPEGRYMQYKIAANSGVIITSATLSGVRAVDASITPTSKNTGKVAIGGDTNNVRKLSTTT